MYYSVLHKTRFFYSEPISESFMEVYMHPRNDATQRCMTFGLTLQPKAAVFEYVDYHGNTVHHFDIPQFHNSLSITAESTVEITEAPPLPDNLPQESWAQLDADIDEGDFWEMLSQSRFTEPTPLLLQLAQDLNLTARRGDPLSLAREINTALYDTFAYAPNSTKVDSPIDDALQARQGVCQDFSHIMLALLRNIHMPARYVSGYIIPNEAYDDRSPEHASHAWVEVYLPGLDWVAFDPTNNLVGNSRHVCVACGRDYMDVSPTKGVFNGTAETELNVGVQVKLMDETPFDENLLPEVQWEEYNAAQHQQLQMQQQQQQQQQ
ncbi:MAG: transglutaminase family protein [Aggregatilineales bacterium]